MVECAPLWGAGDRLHHRPCARRDANIRRAVCGASACGPHHGRMSRTPGLAARVAVAASRAAARDPRCRHGDARICRSAPTCQRAAEQLAERDERQRQMSESEFVVRVRVRDSDREVSSFRGQVSAAAASAAVTGAANV
eukprot:Amastigsp_a177320_16.p4 type:complete len:139 gc:universal Amastigsp_a177320_16:159-575(+)